MRDYYNRRTGAEGPPPRLTLRETASQMSAAFDFLDQQGYLQRSFGYFCVDKHDVAGEQGSDVRTQFLLDTGLRIEPTVGVFLDHADEVGLFTLVEFLHDHVAKPDRKSGWYHSFSGCGWHFPVGEGLFDVAAAQKEWREKVNRVLRFYGDGYELSVAGEVIHLVPDGLGDLVAARAPAKAGDTNVTKLNHAIRTFRLARSSRQERKGAVRELADLLEFYRDDVKRHLKRDEGDLFNIANNFAVRHHNRDQRDDYDDRWLSWMFYTYLATVRLMLDVVHGTSDPEAVVPVEPAEPLPDDSEDLPF